jgi:FtsP/CotA-like multicopper oxidase with cupredoxin domain
MDKEKFSIKSSVVLISVSILIFLAAVFFVYMGKKDVEYSLTLLPDSVSEIQTVQPMQIVELSDGDTFDLEASIMKQEVGNRTIKRLAYNRQIPGPVIKVAKGATVTVNLTNNIDVDTTLHSHGLRLDNAFDGVPDVTQDPIKPGETFSYTLTFPDEGVYWYHPHIREDYTQELGLYGNFIVEGDESYWGEANQEEYLIFDDFLEGGKFDSREVTHTLMGRFGDILLINDDQNFSVEVEVGQVNRFFLTNVANTRVFDLEFEGAQTKLVGGDVGRIQREEFINDAIIAPAERYIVETFYAEAGTYDIIHRGAKVGQVVVVSSDQLAKEVEFKTLRDNSDDYGFVLEGFDNFLSKEADKSVRLSIEMDGMGDMDHGSMSMGDEDEHEHDDNHEHSDANDMGNMMDSDSMMSSDDNHEEEHMHDDSHEHADESVEMREDMMGGGRDSDGIEWEDGMAMMNRMSDDENTEWQIIDEKTGKVNMDIDWSFNQGDLVKVRIFNDPDSMHPMQHPIHFHGQRFVVLARDGVTSDNLQWKDTTLVPTGQTVDILVEMSNLGTWMSHCHIAEHLHSGMMFSFDVLDKDAELPKAVSLSNVVEDYEIQGTQHVAIGQKNHDAYNSNPPSSGWHYAKAPKWGIYKKEIPDESALHAVEHGGIWISYTGVTDEQIDELVSIQKTNNGAVIMSPREKNDTSIAVVSWGKVMKLDEVNTELIQEFINVNKNNTHEPFAR